ncbi:dTDP-glucose 4,6-dehydratase [bacterium]|nr:dTDP-glucose 4,6-dehydratase [bacterium]MBU1753629.1 dTDP-glucose 4,6-dehydratase [bacterium]
MNKKLLVTGGAGFIGSELIRQGVQRGYGIAVIDNLTYAGDKIRIKGVEEKISFYKADITNREFVEHIFRKEKPQIVIHMAAESHVDRSIIDATPFIETNIKGTQVLLDVSKHYGIERFINMSTDEVYGEISEGQFEEASPLDPNSPYSVSKATADMLGRAYCRTYDLPVITVRPSNNYGSWQYPEKLIPVVILKGLNEERIPVYGTGTNVREWLFVSDCVDAIFSIIEQGKIGEVYNIGSGEEKKNIDVVKVILGLLGKSENLIEFVKDRLGHDLRYSLNSDKIGRELDWKAKVSFEEGMENTVRWYVDNMDWVKGKLDYLRQYWGKVYN